MLIYVLGIHSAETGWGMIRIILACAVLLWRVWKIRFGDFYSYFGPFVQNAEYARVRISGL